MKNPYALLKPYVYRYKWRFLGGIVFVFFTNWIAVRIPGIVGDAVNSLTERRHLMDELFDLGVYLVAVAGLAGAFRYLMRRVLIDTSRDIEFDFRNDIYGHLQKLDPSYYDSHQTGDIMSRMTNDIDQVRTMIGPAIMYTANSVFTFPLVLIAMLKLDWRVSLAGIVPLLLMPFLVKQLGKLAHVRYRAQQDATAEMTTFTQESIAGIRVIKAYCQEDSNYRDFDKENDKFIKTSMDVAMVMAFFSPIIRFVSGLGLLGILFVGAREITLARMDYGTLFSLVLLFTMLIWPVIAIGWVYNLFQRASASLDRIAEIMHVGPRVLDGAANVATIPAAMEIDFKNLTFRYETSTGDVLRNINLQVPPGKTIGIVGRVGSGKSTLVHLLPRLYPIERGQLFLGGIDINDWPLDELRRRVAIVFQETFLFSEPIADNIRFGALDELSDEEMIAAATKADVHKDIEKFPKQYQTMLGERGINLSGGQKQRLSLARALVRSASVLILDDALSAVDTHTEEAILSALRDEMRGKTVFLISHRISTVAMADEIIVLEEGSITQRGTHEQLITQEGLYGELHRKQLLEEEVEAIG